MANHPIPQSAGSDRSELSAAPLYVEERIQNEDNERTSRQQLVEAGSLVLRISTAVEVLPDHNNDNGNSKQPSRKINTVRQIENELHLTAAQGRELHVVFQDKMKKARVLGNLNFHAKTKVQSTKLLEGIMTETIKQLPFLRNSALPAPRVRELVLAKAKILNSNERHNQYMVKVGKVTARLDDVSPTPDPTVAHHASTVGPASGATAAPASSRADPRIRRTVDQTVTTSLAGNENNDISILSPNPGSAAPPPSNPSNRRSTITSLNNRSHSLNIQPARRLTDFNVIGRIGAVVPGTLDTLLQDVDGGKIWNGVSRM